MEVTATFLPSYESSCFSRTQTPCRGGRAQQTCFQAQDSNYFSFPSSYLLARSDLLTPTAGRSCRRSPYEIEDNQYLFDSQNCLSKKFINQEIVDRKLISKSPPPLHARPILPQNLKVSNDKNSNEYVTEYGDNLTLEAISNLGLSRSDLFYQPHSSKQQKNIVELKMISVKKEKDRLLSSSHFNPQRSSLPSTFGRQPSPPHITKFNNKEELMKNNRIVTISSRKSLREDSYNQRIQTSDGRRSLRNVGQFNRSRK